MKTKSFKKYLERRLDKDEIAKIKRQAQGEVAILKSIQRGKAKLALSSFVHLLALMGKEPKDVFKSKK